MRAEHERSTGKERPLQASKDGLGAMSVDCTQAVIDEEMPRSAVDRTSERYPSLLPAAQRQAALSNLGQVAVCEDQEVGSEAAAVEGLLVARPVERKAEENIVADLTR